MSIATLLADAARRWGDREFLVGECGFAGLHERARRAAAGLRDRGVRPGDRVALMAHNSPDFVAAWFGIMLAGATAQPIPTSSAPPEVAERASPCRLLLGDEDLPLDGSPAHDGGDAHDGRPAHDGGDAHDGRPAHDGGDARAPALVLHTSGTTGGPRAAAFSHASLVTHTANVARTLDLGDGDVLLGALPLTHSFGLRMVLLLALQVGARIVLMRRFDAAGALGLIERERVTFWPAVPTMLAAVCTLAGPPPPSLRWVLSAGAPLPDALCLRAEARLGCPVRQGYGLTEASFSTLDAPPAPRTLGSVGRPVAGVELRLVDGEIEVRGPHRMIGYVGDAVTPDDAWLRTGDLGRLDGDGRLYVVDRKKDLVIRGGHKVHPSEVEAALAAHDAVAEVAVVGRPDDYWGEEIVAVVVVRPGRAVAPEELVAFARARVAATKVPRELAFVEALPLGPSGKVQKRLLRRQLADGALPTVKPAR